MPVYHSVDEIFRDRRKGLYLDEIMENFIQSPYLMRDLENPFDIFETLQFCDYLNAKTDAWHNLTVEQQLMYAKQYQDWYTKMLGRSSSEFLFERDHMVIEMVLIPPMGILFGKEKLIYNRIAPFWMSKTPITQRQWRRVMGSHHSQYTGVELAVSDITWAQCQEFCWKLDLEIPTEAEWEQACRAGTTTAYSFGDDKKQLKNYACYSKFEPEPVKLHKPNVWGLFDMHGNVWEICQKKEGSSIYPARGGCYQSKASWCRSDMSMSNNCGIKQHDVGFRVIKEFS